MKAYAECLPDSTERVVAIAGSEDQLVSALDMMLKVIDENPIKVSALLGSIQDKRERSRGEY